MNEKNGEALARERDETRLAGTAAGEAGPRTTGPGEAAAAKIGYVRTTAPKAGTDEAGGTGQQDDVLAGPRDQAPTGRPGEYEPGRPEPGHGQAGHGQPEPGRVETSRVETSPAGHDKPEPSRVEPGEPEPGHGHGHGQAEHDQARHGEPEPGEHEHGQPESSRVEPGQTAHGKPEPSQPEPRERDATEPDTEYDVVVVGSGAAGMTAALAAARHGLRVVVLEKAARFGGSTARSGGGVWIPNNEALPTNRKVPTNRKKPTSRKNPTNSKDPNGQDSPEQARAYLEAIVGDVVPAELRENFLDRGPEVVSFIQRHTPLRFQWVPDYSDYHPEAPGGRAGGRSVEPKPLDGHLLGDELANLEPPYSASPLGVPITQADYRWLSLIARHPRGVLRLLALGARWLAGRLTGKHLLSMGQALAAGLRVGLHQAGVTVRLDTPLLDLVTDDDRVTGVVIGGGQTISARLGVILAAGGFEHNEEMRTKYQRQPIGTTWTVGAKANTGDAINAGMKLGAAVDLMDDAWWGPTIPLTGGPWFALAERSRPGCLMVDARGERFVNESAPYVEAVHAMYGPGDGPGAHIPTWLVFDQRYRNRYMFTGIGPRQPLPGRWFKAGIAAKASSLEKLAERIGVPQKALEHTVERFNGFARNGVDEDFHRGQSAYDHYYGDPRNRPNPSLGPLDQPPFYAVKIVPGDLGTKGGLRIDTHARVLREDGSVIAGLYAAGNTSAAVMGHTYAGPGATIGPAMVFGYLAAAHLATQNRTGGRR
jgi:3-oxosteroid 1-dehydrogenase